MRLLIDTRYLPSPETDEPALELIRALIATPDIEAHLWLSTTDPALAVRERQCWSRDLHSARLHHAPALDAPDTPWSRAARAQLDAAAIEALAPALVYTPLPACDLNGADLASDPPDTGAIPWVVSAPPAPDPSAGLSAQIAQRPHLARLWQALKGARALWLETPQQAVALADALLLKPEQLRQFSATDPAARAGELAAALPALIAHQPAEPPRPTLAWLSPLPPERSGIADYSAEILPELARHYRITLIQSGPPLSDPWLAACFPIMDVETFRHQAHRFARILYQMGNSEYHAHMLELLAEHPGVMVLHDVYLGHLHAWRQDIGGEPGALIEALEHAHGLPALRLLAAEGVEAAIWRYPANRALIEAASGLILHSPHARALIAEWVDPPTADRAQVVPHARRLPSPPDRAAARAALGLAADAVVVCSFGFLGESKCNLELIDAWFASSLAERPDAHLVFVGAAGGEHAEAIEARLRQSPSTNPVRITGYAAPEDYRRWLAGADVAVQLRRHSRGESSGTALDCLAHGLALIVNAHGSMVDLPSDALWQLPDDFSTEQLSAALSVLCADPAQRAALGERARAVIAHDYHPRRIADAYRDAIEASAHDAPQARQQHLIARMARLPASAAPRELDALAEALALHAPAARPHWYLDISALRLAPHVTGIERVTLAHLTGLLDDPPPGVRIEPVYIDPEVGYRVARRYLPERLGLSAPLAEPPILPRAGDLFFGLDWTPHAILASRERLTIWRARGVRCWFLVHDILPVTNPEWFPPHIPALFRDWLDALGALADGCVCVSAATAEALAEWWRARGLDPLPRLEVAHNGADFSALDAAPSIPLDPDLEHALSSAPSLLMVGTIEPRKGHRHALAALERLWSDGIEVNLIIVGREGWLHDSPADRAPIRALVQRLREHPQLGQRLFWPSEVDDATLATLYRRASALLAAAENEGFGLPLIEAAHHGLALIARDIPVFREIAGEHAWYFDAPTHSDADGQALAASLNAWLAASDAGAVPASSGLNVPGWSASTARLCAILLQCAN